MNCAECRELLVGYIEKLLEDSQKQAVEAHLEMCPPCRAKLTELSSLRERLTANGKALSQTNLENAVFDRIVQEQSLRLRKVSKLDKQIQLWRKIMKSRITKLATAAAIIVIAALSITYFDQLVAPAYAIEQTIKANHTVRYLHIKDFDSEHEDEPRQFWLEFDESGQVKNVRMDFPEWAGGGDGPKIVVWKEEKAQAWLPKKNVFLTVRDKTVASHMLKFAEECDPRLAVQRLYEQEAQGKLKIEIDEPSNKAEPVVVTATYLPESSTPGKRAVLVVDQATKLITSIEFYRLKNGKYEYTGVMEFFDYNQPIAAEMFVLEDEVPADAIRIDQTAQEVGLAQGNLTDEEIAVEVVRQFLEALINKDYAKAGRLYGGMPAENMQTRYGRFNVVRIISIGEPEPHPIPKVGGFRVPCKVEIEKEGVKSIWEPYGAGVRQVHGRPGCWGIHGGV